MILLDQYNEQFRTVQNSTVQCRTTVLQVLRAWFLQESKKRTLLSLFLFKVRNVPYFLRIVKGLPVLNGK